MASQLAIEQLKDVYQRLMQDHDPKDPDAADHADAVDHVGAALRSLGLDPASLDMEAEAPAEPAGGERFWKTTLGVVVVTRGEQPPEYETLADVHAAITTGDASGDWTQNHRAISPKAAAKALVEMGSDPAFLGLED